MGSLGPTELIIIGVVLVLLFGATRLPQTAKGVGQALRLFKKEIRDDDKEEASGQDRAETSAAQTTPPSISANGSAQPTPQQAPPQATAAETPQAAPESAPGSPRSS